MKQLTIKAYNELKNDILEALTKTQHNFQRSTGKVVYKAPIDADAVEKMMIEHNHINLDNGIKLTESGIILARLCCTKFTL